MLEEIVLHFPCDDAIVGEVKPLMVSRVTSIFPVGRELKTSHLYRKNTDQNAY